MYIITIFVVNSCFSIAIYSKSFERIYRTNGIRRARLPLGNTKTIVVGLRKCFWPLVSYPKLEATKNRNKMPWRNCFDYGLCKNHYWKKSIPILSFLSSITPAAKQLFTIIILTIILLFVSIFLQYMIPFSMLPYCDSMNDTASTDKPIGLTATKQMRRYFVCKSYYTRSYHNED